MTRNQLAYATSAGAQLVLIGILAVCPGPLRQRLTDVVPLTIEMVFDRGQAPTVAVVSMASPTPIERPVENAERPTEPVRPTEAPAPLPEPELPPLVRERLTPETRPTFPTAELVQTELPPVEVESLQPDATEAPPPPQPAPPRRESVVEIPPPPSVEALSLASDVGADVDEPPKALPANPPTTYPRLALQRRAGGTVVLSITVGADGTVEQVEIEQSSGHADLDQAAVENRRRWRFLPALKDAQPVRFTVRQRVVFQLPGA